MKKIKYIILTITSLFAITGCFKQDRYADITIYTTAYPIEYITKELYGDYSSIDSIYPNGANIETYEISNKKINTFSESDLFIYNGLNNEKDLVANLLKKNKKLDIIDVAKGIEIKYNTNELWLYPSNILKICSNIKNGLKQNITNTTILDEIDDNYEKLKLKISEFDAELYLLAKNAENKKIIVGNEALKFLETKYGFEVIYISKDEDQNSSNFIQAQNLLKNETNKYIFKLQNDEENESLKALVTSGGEIKNIDNMAVLTDEWEKNNIDYLSLLNNFIDAIKSEIL